MTDDELERIVAGLVERLTPAPPEPPPPPPAVHPHKVHVAGGAIKTVTSTVRTFDQARAPDGAPVAGELEGNPYWEIDDVTSTYAGPRSCPDCGLGLRSDGTAMTCSRLEPGAMAACHPGCTVACGVTSDG
jgi:hypothetical protein